MNVSGLSNLLCGWQQKRNQSQETQQLTHVKGTRCSSGEPRLVSPLENEDRMRLVRRHMIQSFVMAHVVPQLLEAEIDD